MEKDEILQALFEPPSSSRCDPVSDPVADYSDEDNVYMILEPASLQDDMDLPNNEPDSSNRISR